MHRDLLRVLGLAAAIAGSGCQTNDSGGDASVDLDGGKGAGDVLLAPGPDGSAPGPDAAIAGPDAASLAPVGASCAVNGECASGTCYTSFPGGYCTATCSSAACPAGSVCKSLGAPLCLAICTAGECRPGYQCFDGACIPPCTGSAGECGPGAHCQAGACVKDVVTPCAKDGDCQSQLCLLPEKVCTTACGQTADCLSGGLCAWRPQLDVDGNRTGVRSVCVSAPSGLATGAACKADGDCLSTFCHLGTCSEACKTGCPSGLTCMGTQEPLKAAYFRAVKACLPGQGTTVWDITSRPATDPSTIPVPDNTVSFSLVMQTGDAYYPLLLNLFAPDGTQLLSSSDPDPLAEPERYYPENQVGTMFMPNTPVYPVQLGKGPYKYLPMVCDANNSCDQPLDATHVYYKFAPGAKQDTGQLTVNFFFNGLANHPCGNLTAANAASSSAMQGVLTNFRAIYAKAGLTIATVNYHDLNRSDLYTVNGEDEATLNKLFETSSTETNRAVNVFLVRSLTPQGLLGVAGGIPGPPLHGTAHSGIVATWEGQCYGVMGNVIPHEVGHYLGLFHNIEADAKGNDDPTHQDALPDTNTSHDNLMYWNEEGGDEVSAGQGWVMRGNFLVE